MNLRNQNSLEFDVFLSHSSADNRIVRRLHRRLERYKAPGRAVVPSRKLRVFHYQTDLPLSLSLRQALANRVSEIDQIVVVVSPDAACSEYVDFEIRTYIESHSEHKLFVVLARGEAADVFPLSLKKSYPGASYSDICGCDCNFFSWWLWQRWRFKSITLPLIARLFSVDTDVLIRRERRQRFYRVLSISVVVLTIFIIFLIGFFQTPERAWMQSQTTEKRSVSRAVLIRLQNGIETIRTLSLWDQYFVSDVPDNPHGIIDEFDTTGKLIGSFHYFLDAGGEGDIYPWPDRRMRNSRSIPIADSIAIIQKPPQLNGGPKGIPCRIENGGIISAGEYLFDLNVQEFKANAEDEAQRQGITEPLVLYQPTFFELSDYRVLAASYIYPEDEHKSGTLIQISHDRGKTWKASKLIPELDASNIVAVSATKGNKPTFHIAFAEEPENPIPNALLLSDDEEGNWRYVNLPSPVLDFEHWLFEDFAVGQDSNYIVISAVKYASRPLNRKILFSENGGETWAALDTEQPSSISLELIGIAGGHTVVGLFHEGLIGGGKLTVVLENGRSARRQMTSTERRGDLENGRIFLWRELMTIERIRWMWF
jgi:hypothetical protein